MKTVSVLLKEVPGVKRATFTLNSSALETPLYFFRMRLGNAVHMTPSHFPWYTFQLQALASLETSKPAEERIYFEAT